MPDRLRSTARRRFLATAAAGTCAAVPSLRVAASALGPDPLAASRFAALVGTSFVARPLGDPAATPRLLRLREVAPLARVAPTLSANAAAERSFELVFDVDGGHAGQDSYAVTHEALPPFVALMAPNRHATRLVAVFNRVA